MAKFKNQRVRDPLHDLIKFSANEFENGMWRVIQTPEFQRLRRVKQLGFSELVYPGATHTRFAHSIGVFHTARQLMSIIEDQQGAANLQARRRDTALAAALVHDIGHGPFSHSFETVAARLKLPSATHEVVSASLIRDSEISAQLDKAMGNGFSLEVSSLIAADGPTDIYSSVVSSQFDADRLDYMRRDKLMTGTQHSEIDYTWLLENLRLGEVPSSVDEEATGLVETLVLDEKAIHAAETYVLGLFQLYPTVYFHKATRSAEKIFQELLFRVISLVGDGSTEKTGLGSQHPLCAFAREPKDILNFLCLDDSVIWGSLSQMLHAEDQTVSNLAKRLRDRELLVCIDIREAVSSSLGPNADAAAVEKAVEVCLDEIGAWYADNNKSECMPRVILDKAQRRPYKMSENSGSPLNQMMVVKGKGLVNISDISETVRAAQVFKLDRAYIDRDDTEAKTKIESILRNAIREEEKNAA
tara:strand:- start:750 stop:2165 length:1416 start_codon:yes stop_codon:yes gene_type:complete